MHPNQMTEDQLQEITNQINQIFLYLISHTAFDPNVVEVMKLSALTDVHKRFENGEPW
jgi:hypothetical protein